MACLTVNTAHHENMYNENFKVCFTIIHGRSFNLVHGGLAGAHGMASTSSASLRESEGAPSVGSRGKAPGQGVWGTQSPRS